MRMQTEMELRMFKQNEYIYHTMREAALKNQPVQMMSEPIEEGIKSLFRKKWPQTAHTLPSLWLLGMELITVT